MKTLVLDRCKEMGIKSSNRGLIAGEFINLYYKVWNDVTTI